MSDDYDEVKRRNGNDEEIKKDEIGDGDNEGMQKRGDDNGDK